MARLNPYRPLIALIAVMALVAPIRPAMASAAPLDTAIAAVDPADVQIDTTIDYQHAIGAGTGCLLTPDGACQRGGPGHRRDHRRDRQLSGRARR